MIFIQKILPIVVEWVANQEAYILKHGVPLTEDQKIDAYLVGVREIEKIRIWHGPEPPIKINDQLKLASEMVGLSTTSSTGISFRYAIFMKKDHWNTRRLLIHELTHTMQYERLGGISEFLNQYLNECLELGYPNGFLEKEAREMETKICEK